MHFVQFYLDCLSQASYLVGDEATGRAVVVDPRRDVQSYLDDAAAAGLRIERVIETHVHADFLSGHLELAEKTGAVVSYGAGTDVDFPIEPLHDGQRLSLGDVTLDILATPGHTPESISVVVREHAADPVPFGVMTGDTMFIGDVGRPDLLARRASPPTTWRAGSTGRFTRSCSRFRTRPGCSPPTGRDRRAGRTCRRRRSPRSASSGAPTTPSSR